MRIIRNHECLLGVDWQHGYIIGTVSWGFNIINGHYTWWTCSQQAFPSRLRILQLISIASSSRLTDSSPIPASMSFCFFISSHDGPIGLRGRANFTLKDDAYCSNFSLLHKYMLHNSSSAGAHMPRSFLGLYPESSPSSWRIDRCKEPSPHFSTPSKHCAFSHCSTWQLRALEANSVLSPEQRWAAGIDGFDLYIVSEELILIVSYVSFSASLHKLESHDHPSVTYKPPIVWNMAVSNQRLFLAIPSLIFRAANVFIGFLAMNGKQSKPSLDTCRCMGSQSDPPPSPAVQDGWGSPTMFLVTRHLWSTLTW